MYRALLASIIALLEFGSAVASDAPLTLEQIMADPDWIGATVEEPFWGLDGQHVYYRIKRAGSPIRDLHRIDLATGQDSGIDAAAMAQADAPAAALDMRRTRAAFVRNGDVFLRDLASGRLTQVTRTPQDEASPQFSPDGRTLSFRVEREWFSYDIESAVTAPAAVLKLEKDPDAMPPADDLRDLQLRVFSNLKQAHNEKEAARKHAQAMQQDDPTRAPLPFYLGEDLQLVETALSPDARWLLAVTTPKGYDEGKKGKLTRFVTESGFEEFEDERTRVGRSEPAPHTLWLLDLRKHERTQLAYADLPGIHDDPLKSVREENQKQVPAADSDNAKKARGDNNTQSHKGKDASGKDAVAKDKVPDKPKDRTLQITGIAFARDGSNVAVQLHAIDNKDRWLATVDLSARKLVVQQRLSDDAWINWSFNDFGWEHDDRTLWYLSEESGYAQLYATVPGGKSQALTQGRFEVGSPALSPDGQWFYLRSNAQAPYAYDIYRVPVAGGKLERITQVAGAESFALSPDGRQLLVAHSTSYVPRQIGVLAADGGALRELTDTRTPQYQALAWVQPEIVEVPSAHTRQPIYAKFYKPDNFDKSNTYSAVLFVHGAGYTQNVHRQYPYYFREQMFHNLLLQHGYLVLDMDYRASEGYGRDWRTAIYRQMGHPELEDLLDGKRWLVENWSVDPKRVGVYGGSYGGFMTLIAMFRAPGEFAAGAALRPVTDWTQYNHEYTANILNTPKIDPIAYRRSSPLEFAAGLSGALLICHGLIDDNVLPEDSIRLYQRLIELHKDGFQMSLYPLERHGFTHADAWLDEYKRIFRLFEANLK